MTTSLISPSGTVLLHRASVSTEPNDTAVAKPIRICLIAYGARAPWCGAQPGAHESESGAAAEREPVT